MASPHFSPAINSLLPPPPQVVMQCFLVIMFSSHWFACIIALQASLHTSVHSTLAGSELYALCGTAVNTQYSKQRLH